MGLFCFAIWRGGSNAQFYSGAKYVPLPLFRHLSLSIYLCLSHHRPNPAFLSFICFSPSFSYNFECFCSSMMKMHFLFRWTNSPFFFFHFIFRIDSAGSCWKRHSWNQMLSEWSKGKHWGEYRVLLGTGLNRVLRTSLNEQLFIVFAAVVTFLFACSNECGFFCFGESTVCYWERGWIGSCALLWMNSSSLFSRQLSHFCLLVQMSVAFFVLFCFCSVQIPHVVRLRTLVSKAIGVLFSVAGGQSLSCVEVDYLLK